MADVVSPVVRSRMMAGIRGKNTRPEILVRSLLHKKGFRFRLHDQSLPGKPDLVFRRYHAVIFVQGCFWHGHDCHLFKWPATRRKFWRKKITANKRNDRLNHKRLASEGWRILDIWECALKGRVKMDSEKVLSVTVRWLNSGIQKFEIKCSSCASLKGEKK